MVEPWLNDGSIMAMKPLFVYHAMTAEART